MCSLMYGLSVKGEKPQYENWCNCCVVILFSPWVTPGSSLYFSLSLLFFACDSPSPLLHAHLLSVSLFAVSFPSHIAFPPYLPVPLSHSQPLRPDLAPLLDEERGFCLPPAVVTWRHAGGDSKVGKPAAYATTPHKCATVCLELTVGGYNKACVCLWIVFTNSFIHVSFPSLFVCISFICTQH